MSLWWDLARGSGRTYEAARRVKVLRVDPQVLAEMCKPQGLICIEVSGDPLPPDATVVACYVVPSRNDVDLLIASAEYPVLPEGHVPMILTPTKWTRYTGNQAIVNRLREIDMLPVEDGVP